jgi:protein phosphatase PTC7
MVLEGVAFGVADGVGGWVESAVDPSLFSQALMYHAHRYSRNAWAGEPEIDPTLDYEEREQIEGWEMTPYECLGLAYYGVLREKMVQAGKFVDERHLMYHQFYLTRRSGSSTACIISLNAANGTLRSAKYVINSRNAVRNSSFSPALEIVVSR